jgi:hypothetical protein
VCSFANFEKIIDIGGADIASDKGPTEGIPLPIRLPPRLLDDFCQNVLHKEE